MKFAQTAGKFYGAALQTSRNEVSPDKNNKLNLVTNIASKPSNIWVKTKIN
jgi:hypothetical protein